jgi:hypothetical protein
VTEEHIKQAHMTFCLRIILSLGFCPYKKYVKKTAANGDG